MDKVLQNQNSCATIEQPQPTSYTAPKAAFIPIVIRNRLAFKFDPVRGLVEYQIRGEKHLIDLSRPEDYRE